MTRRRPPVVLVIGASPGIGAAIARVFAGELRDAGGCRLALVVSNTANLCRVAQRCLRARATKAETFVCDVTDGMAVDALQKDSQARAR